MARFVLAVLLGGFVLDTAAMHEEKSAKAALQGFHDLIGSWKGTGTPLLGTKDERARGFWQETIRWQWQFKNNQAWLKAEIDKGKYYSTFELRHVADTDKFELRVVTLEKELQVFTGTFTNKKLIVERSDEKTKQQQRLVFSLLHFNRHLYHYETKANKAASFTRIYQVGATKEGVAFASEEKGPECIVSGGRGTMPVFYKGKTYYVCCTGCRDAFREDPEKYIKEFEEAKKRK